VTQTPNRLRTIFDEALEIGDPQARRDFVSRSCGANEMLRREVEDLLRVEGVAPKFLPDAPQGMPPSPFGSRMSSAVQKSGNERLTGEVGNRIGRYKVLQKLGEGGCGVVYMAEQQEPVLRKVALKVIKLGMDTKNVVARFQAEEQALARMDHPNIARVFDGGTTETGRPFFVMELVRGIKITEYCDQNELSTRERLELFVQVCQAVQHAHQKGIIHRDLKPSNILVTENGGVATPKVIDFGIAKATQGRLTDQTLFTAFEQFLGTPAYMSPEQAAVTTADVDTRSDIYSLGVLLYELLTGTTPFDTKMLLAAGFDEMRRTILEQEPERPSTRLSAMGKENLTLRAQHRQLEPPKLIHLVRGDLDWIVMKCLEKERSRRYETANGVAMDIKRHLSNEPVLARPRSRLYQFRK
jgi:serine/threonine protein kinase